MCYVGECVLCANAMCTNVLCVRVCASVCKCVWCGRASCVWEVGGEREKGKVRGCEELAAGQKCGVYCRPVPLRCVSLGLWAAATGPIRFSALSCACLGLTVTLHLLGSELFRFRSTGRLPRSAALIPVLGARPLPLPANSLSLLRPTQLFWALRTLPPLPPPHSTF